MSGRLTPGRSPFTSRLGPAEVGLCPGPPARGPPACRHWLCWAPAGHAPARAMATRGTSPAGWADLARSYLQGWPRSQTAHVCENRSGPARDTPEGDPTSTGDFGAGGLSCQPGGRRTPSRFWASLCPTLPARGRLSMHAGGTLAPGRGEAHSQEASSSVHPGLDGAGLGSDWHVTGLAPGSTDRVPAPSPPAPVWGECGDPPLEKGPPGSQRPGQVPAHPPWPQGAPRKCHLPALWVPQVSALAWGCFSGRGAIHTG